MKKEHWLYLVIALLAIWVIVSYAKAPKTNRPSTPDNGSDLGDGTNTDNPADPFLDIQGSLDDNNNSDVLGSNTGVMVSANIPTVAKVMVSNQLPGNIVKIDSVDMTVDGWVAVHEDRAGSPGNILGARRFNAGSYLGGQVALLRGTVAGGMYYVMIHSDDGDGKFDHKIDLAYMQDGQVVMATFMAN